MQRRRLGLAFAALACVVSVSARPAAPPAVRRVPVVIRKFAFSVSEVHARAGESIVLELISTDFVHGFALPELNVRVDVPPGRTVELSLVALRAGLYTFLCDNFCGEGHDRMTGQLVVAEQPVKVGWSRVTG